MSGKITRTVESRLMSFITKTNTCWLWNGATNKGYGIIGKKRKTYKAHRVSWELNFGEIPKNAQVLHKCDNPGCVNPEHLFLGTQEDNMKDMILKRRHWCQNKTHCPKGHPLVIGNLTSHKKQRACLQCSKERKKKKQTDLSL